jgi:ribonuclease Z
MVPQGGLRTARTEAIDNSAQIRRGIPMMEYVLIPRAKKGFCDTTSPDAKILAEKEAIELVQQSGASTLAEKILQECGDDNNSNGPSAGSPTQEAELFFTGTGSAIPCKHRNVTGMLLRGSDSRGILLDVGEGTVGQLLRIQAGGDSGLLESIKAIWISHPHADHHLGVLRLLHEREASDPVLLLAPEPLFRFLEEYSAIDPSIADAYVKIDCKDLVHENPVLRDQIQKALGITSCRAVRVTHCAHAYAVVLDGTDFGRLVYSGDCRPSTVLADIAKGADLLIHEATFEDGMEAEAALKRHSTVGEALGVAKRMEAKCIVLTHFSQRYPRIPPMPAEEKGLLPTVFAFDYMRLTPRNLDAASKLTPALRLLYPEEEPKEDTEGERRNGAEAIMAVPGLFAHNSLL